MSKNMSAISIAVVVCVLTITSVGGLAYSYKLNKELSELRTAVGVLATSGPQVYKIDLRGMLTKAQKEAGGNEEKIKERLDIINEKIKASTKNGGVVLDSSVVVSGGKEITLTGRK